MSRTSPSTRVVHLYKLLRHGPVTVDQAQAEIGMCRRSFYNYLWAIEDAGVHLASEPDPERSHGTRWRILAE